MTELDTKKAEEKNWRQYAEMELTGEAKSVKDAGGAKVRRARPGQDEWVLARDDIAGKDAEDGSERDRKTKMGIEHEEEKEGERSEMERKAKMAREIIEEKRSRRECFRRRR
jgi:hypothetical protein